MRGEGKKTKKKTYQKTMEEAQNSRFVEINHSGVPKMRGRNKFEKGGTGVENGWGKKNGPHRDRPIKKIKFFFQNFFFREFHSPSN